MKEEYASEDSDRSCCSRNGCTICLTVFLVISLASLGIISYSFVQFHLSGDVEICTEIECVKSSAEIDEYIDKSVNPCTDFHGFVCGKFMKTAYEKQQSHPLKFQDDRLKNKINSFIVEPYSDEDLKPVRMQKMYFQSCLNEDRIDENNNTLFFALLNEIGGWPILSEEHWSMEKELSYNWIDAIVRAKQLGLPFGWFLDVDIHDNGHYLLKISKSKSCSNINLSEDNKIYFVGKVLSIFKSHNNDMQKVYDIIRLEQKLAQICEKVSNDSISITTLSELEKNCKICHEFVLKITENSRRWRMYSEVAYHENYVIKLADLLQNTSKETLANYIGWKTVEYFTPYMSKNIRDIYKEHLNRISEEKVDRFEFCLEDTKSKFNLVSETMYIREYTTPSVKEAGEELVDSLREEMKIYIENREDMDNETKSSPIKYLDELETVIGAPDEVFNDAVFDRILFIGQLTFRSFNIVQMITHWSESIFYSKMKMIGQRSPNALLNFAYLANRGFGVFLNTEQKTILLPATLLHGVTFDINRPHYLNYASLGSLIGKKFIETLQLSENYTNEFREEQEECLMKSVNTFNSHLDTTFILKSNYPDLVGRHIAYNAYQKLVEESGEEGALAGLPYSPNMLFWIKSSINWCFQTLPDDDTSSVFQDMLKYRITETAKHSPYFGNDFKCEDGAKMNPSQKCTVI